MAGNIQLETLDLIKISRSALHFTAIKPIKIRWQTRPKTAFC